MPDEDAIERRLAAVERALTDGREAPAGLRADAALADRVEELEATTADLERRVADLDAAVQALRGYVGNVRHVNREVERRAEAALAAADGTPVGDDFASPEGSPPESDPPVDAPVEGGPTDDAPPDDVPTDDVSPDDVPTDDVPESGDDGPTTD